VVKDILCLLNPLRYFGVFSIKADGLVIERAEVNGFSQFVTGTPTLVLLLCSVWSHRDCQGRDEREIAQPSRLRNEFCLHWAIVTEFKCKWHPKSRCNITTMTDNRNDATQLWHTASTKNAVIFAFIS